MACVYQHDQSEIAAVWYKLLTATLLLHPRKKHALTNILFSHIVLNKDFTFKYPQLSPTLAKMGIHLSGEFCSHDFEQKLFLLDQYTSICF